MLIRQKRAAHDKRDNLAALTSLIDIFISESNAAGLIITASLASSAVWILDDRHVWPWDQALYGDATLQIWQAHLSGIRAWVHAIIQALGWQPPLLAWLGQLFVPLWHLTGDFESAILLVNLLSAGGTLTLIYCAARHLGANRLSSLAGISFCAGSGLFIGMTHQYMGELTQCFAAASCVAVAWGAEKRSSIRTLALVMAIVALSFLSKASSMTFVLPMLTYIATVRWISRRKERPTFQPSDAVLLLGATLITALAAAWYAENWQAVMQHFAVATTDLHWGSPVNLPVKLSYWTDAFIKTISPFAILSICIAATIAAALAISAVRLLKRQPREWAEASVENGALFAFALGGTVIATIFTFSLQINEDRRFLIPLVPMASVLVAWSLSTIRRPVVEHLVFCSLAMNATVNHAYSHGIDPFRITPAPYLLQVDLNDRDKEILSEAVRSTCYREHSHRPNLIVVSYASLNVNSINFYATKESYATGYRCDYTTYNSFDPDVQHALNTIAAIAPLYIVTVVPDKQSPPDFVNGASRSVTEHLATDPHYKLASGSGSYLQIYRSFDQQD
jgi:hypothetical protein